MMAAYHRGREHASLDGVMSELVDSYKNPNSVIAGGVGGGKTLGGMRMRGEIKGEPLYEDNSFEAWTTPEREVMDETNGVVTADLASMTTEEREAFLELSTAHQDAYLRNLEIVPELEVGKYNPRRFHNCGYSELMDVAVVDYKRRYLVPFDHCPEDGGITNMRTIMCAESTEYTPPLWYVETDDDGIEPVRRGYQGGSRRIGYIDTDGDLIEAWTPKATKKGKK